MDHADQRGFLECRREYSWGSLSFPHPLGAKLLLPWPSCDHSFNQSGPRKQGGAFRLILLTPLVCSNMLSLLPHGFFENQTDAVGPPKHGSRRRSSSLVHGASRAAFRPAVEGGLDDEPSSSSQPRSRGLLCSA